jgi:hypothetical protein
MVALLVTGVSASSLGQEAPIERVGDSTVVARIDAQTRILYDSTERWVFALTRGNVLREPGAYGTEVQAGFRAGEPVRIIAGGWTRNGKFGVEFYRVGGELVFTYESAERFREAGGKGWRNFKGNVAWERRTYLVNGRIAYAATTGEGAPPLSADRLRGNLERVLGLLKASAKPPNPGAD